MDSNLMTDGVISLDDRPAVRAIDNVNDRLDGHEKKAKTVLDRAGKEWQVYGDSVVRISDKGKNALDRLLQSMERQASIAGKSGADRMIAERDLLIKKWQDEERAVTAITKAYDKMIAAESGSGSSRWQAFSQGIKGFVEQPLNSIKEAAGGVLEKMGLLWTGIGAGVTVLTAVAAAGFEAAKSLGNYGLEIKNVELRTGLTSKEVGQFSFAARMAGQDASIFERMMKGLSQAADEQSKQGEKARSTLKGMGIDLRSVTGEMKPTSQLLLEISQGLGKLPEGVQRDAAAMDLFKKIGVEAIPVISGLADNVKRAKDMGLGATEEDLRRWEQYHEKVTEAEVLWERFTRKIKEPLAAVVTFLFQDRSGNEYSLDDLQKRGVNLGKWGPKAPLPPVSPEAAQWERNITKDAALDYVGKIQARQQGDAAVAAYESGQGLAGQLKQAEAALATMAKPEKGISSAQDVSEYREAERHVESLKNQIEAAKKGTQELTELRRQATEFAKHGEEAELTALGKIFYQRDLLLKQAEKVKASEADIAGIRRSASEQALWIAKQDIAKTRPVPVASALPVLTNPMTPDEVKEWNKAFGQVDSMGFKGRVDAANRNAKLAERMVGLNGATGMDAISQEYQIKVNLANQLAGIDADRIRSEVKGSQQLIDATKAQMDLKQQMAEAEQEAALKQLELEKQRTDMLKQRSEGLWNTLLTNPRQFGRQLGTTVHEAVLKPVTEGMASMTANVLKPVIYGADGQSGIAGMFRGVFGGGKQDPLKLSTDMNTAVTAQNSAAMAALTAIIAGVMGISAPAMAAPSGIGGVSVPGISMMAPSVSIPSISFGGGGGGSSSGPMVFGGGGTAAATPPFLGGGSTGIGGLAGMMKNFRGINLGGLTRSPSRWSMDENGDMSEINGGRITGVNGLLGTAMFTGGTMLAQQGLLGSSRGTWGGVGMGAAGGAAIGFQMGGPLGGLIGGGAGLLAGLGEKIAGVETPENEAKRLIKQIYALNIDDNTAKQIAGIAKQSYGGNVSSAVRSAEVRQLLQLVAESTGQKSNLFLQNPQGASLTQSGGSLYQSAVYNNGTPYTYASNLPVMGPAGSQIPTGNPYGGGFTVMVDPAATMNLWATGTAQGIAGSPRLVANSAVNGGMASSARVSSAIMTLAPDQVAF